MGIEKYEFLDDRVRVYYHLRAPYGYPDKDDVKEIFYSSLDTLPLLPEKIPSGGVPEWVEEVFIPKMNRTIAFIFSEYRSGGGPPDETISYPYIKPTKE